MKQSERGTASVSQRVELGIHGLNRWLVKCIEMSRSLSEKQVKVDKDLRRAAAERFFVFRGIPHFVPGGEIRKSLL